jgi:hypothetical protein
MITDNRIPELAFGDSVRLIIEPDTATYSSKLLKNVKEHSV